MNAKPTKPRSHPRTQAQNQLYYGDNLDILRNKIATESVDLCYIDPPFNSRRDYFQIYNNQGSEDRAQAQAFVDTWEWGDEAKKGFEYITDIANLNNGKLTPKTVALIKGLHEVLDTGALLAYLVHMTLRIVEIHRVLKPAGSFYLHCDPTASHYLKLILDAVFCGQGGEFQNEVIWSYRRWPTKASRFQRMHDVVLFYTRSTRPETFSTLLNAPTASSIKRWKGKTQKVTFDESGKRNPTLEAGEDSAGVAMNDVWDIPVIAPVAKERLGYPTQKPEALLERIIKASSNEGDVVLDAYCGCGTTVAVAQRLKRRWIGIDITYQSISLILKRLRDSYPKAKDWEKIEKAMLLDGVPRDMASAVALAHRKDDKTRKEFEKWAVLTYSDNQARINDKMGADGGIDGTAYFLADRNAKGKDVLGKAIFQVKSGKVQRDIIAKLKGDCRWENPEQRAEIGILITLDEPTKPMRDEALAAGKYEHPMLKKEYARIQIVTVAEILNGARLDLPMARDAVKSAEAVGDKGDQDTLPGINNDQ